MTVARKHGELPCVSDAERATAKEIEEAIAGYLHARNRFLEVANRHQDLLKGNDNIIGRIGEFLAMCFLKRQGRETKKVELRSEKGHDLLDGDIRISVKILTTENARGRGLRLTEPWDELVLIDFDTKTLSYRVGHLLKPDFDRALAEKPKWSRRPIVKRTMLGNKGLIGQYGKVFGPTTPSESENGHPCVPRGQVDP